MKELILKYLIGPIIADAQNKQEIVLKGVTAYPGYNIYNTVLYALLAISILYLTYRIIETHNIDFNASVALHSLPFILLGGSLRFLEDTQAMPFPYNILLITPIVHILVAILYIPSITYLGKKQVAKLGAALLIPVIGLSIIQFQQLRLVYTTAVLVTASVLTLVYRWIAAEKYRKDHLVAVAGSQFFGGAAAMYASFYDYTPKQLLAQHFNSIFGPPGIMVLKAIIVILAVDVLTDIEDDRLKAITLMTVYAVGLGTGFRVFLRAAAGI